MQLNFVWSDGLLDYSPVLHHVNLMQRMGVRRPANIVGGTYDARTGHCKPLYGHGIHPAVHELRFLLESDLERYEDREEPHHYAATVEDTEPEFNLGFLEDPHDTLYPCAWENDKMRSEAKKAIVGHVMEVIHKAGYEDAEQWIHFTVFGSGASYNWDETGDFDVQMWVDIDKYNESHNSAMTVDDLIKDIRAAVQTVNFPSFADLSLQTKDNDGAMLIQYYPQPGTGSKEENLAKKPYACYDIDLDEWLERPKPFTPDFYGIHFLAIQNKADDIAVQAEALINELQRNVLSFQFWSGLWSKYKNDDYIDAANKAQDAAEVQKEGIATLFHGVFGGRQEAYSPEGKGAEDERDAIEKLLEVWGIFQKLKHHARAPLPWEEQELPKEPEKESHWQEMLWKEADVEDGEDPMSIAGDSFGFINGHLILGHNHHQAIMGALLNNGWTFEQMMEAEQCWGWFHRDWEYNDEMTKKVLKHIDVRFTSDAGYQHEEAEEKCLSAFEALFKVPAKREHYHKDVSQSGKQYGEGLAGKDNINYYLKNQDQTGIVPTTPIPPPPGAATVPPSQGEQLNLFDHPIPGGGKPPPKKNEQMPGPLAEPMFPGPPKKTPQLVPGDVVVIEDGTNLHGTQGTIIEDVDSDGEYYIEDAVGDYVYVDQKYVKKAGFLKFADWDDLMQKAQRLRGNGQVQIQVNEPDHVVGQVQGDHGSYQTEIWRDDPQSQAITMWDCECPWSQYSWGRTRQWKKYEGRPCAHTLALFWQAQATPPADTQQQAPEQAPPVPAPGGAMVPQQGLVSPVPIPNQVLPVQGIPGPGGQPAPGTGVLPPGGPVGGPPPSPISPQQTQSVPTTPDTAKGTVKIPGALSHVQKTAQFENGTHVRNRNDVIGEDTVTSIKYTVPQNSAGTVLYSDSVETVVIFPLKGGNLSPHLVKVEGLTYEFYEDAKTNPFIRRRSQVSL